MSVDPIVITVPAPTQWLNANHRKHWAAKARDVRLWRDAACIHTRRVTRHSFGDRQVHITAWCHMKTARKFDAGNYAPTAKACVDGMRDAGLLVEDDNAHVLGPDMRAGEPWATPALVLVIEAAS